MTQEMVRLLVDRGDALQQISMDFYNEKIEMIHYMNFFIPDRENNIDQLLNHL